MNQKILEALERIATAVEHMAKPKRWEYRSKGGLDDIEKNDLGADGWELVGAWDGQARFKREVRDDD